MILYWNIKIVKIAKNILNDIFLMKMLSIT